MNVTEIKSLRQNTARLINDGQIHRALADIRSFALANNDHTEDAALDRLDADYSMMLRYFIDGINDPGRDQIIADIADRARAVADRLARRALMLEPPTLYYITARALSRRTSETIATVADQYLAEARRLAADIDSITDANRSRAAESMLRDLFNRLWVTHPLSGADTAAIQRFCAEARRPAACSAVGGLLLGALEFFDPARLAVLLHIYMNATDDHVAIRALTAFLLAAFRYRRRAIPRSLANVLAAAKDVPTWKSDLKAITIELMRTRDTDKISEQMRTEVFPALSRLAPEINDKIDQGDFQMESLMEGGNPEWEEMLNREGLGEKLRQMSEIQAEGGDIYMSSFAKLKHFPFFNEVANWFLPFDPEYSDVAQSDSPAGGIARSIQRMSLLCDNDKYSIMLSLSSMPYSARQAAQTAMDGENEQFSQMLSELAKADDKNIRRTIANNFVRDLYRFCNLFRRKVEFFNPFEHNVNLLQVSAVADDFDDLETLNVIAEFCIKHGFWSEAEHLLKRIDSLSEPSDRRAQKLGYCIDCQGRHLEAVSHYEEAEMLGGAGPWLLRRMARALRRAGKAARALDCYRRLLESEPDNITTIIEVAGAALEANQPAEAESLFYKAVYLDEQSLEARRGLAWAQFLNHKFAEADHSYAILLKQEPTAEDQLNAGHVARALGQTKRAIALYAAFAHANPDNPDALASALSTDRRWLIDAGIDTATDRLLIEATLITPNS